MPKISYNLYRVSSAKQLYRSPDNKDDIPMQRQACREFAEKMGWVVGAEYEEKGVSASKVSAEKRDAIIDLKEAARKGEFQVLLVFMFDRLGRIDDETPFVLEWFVKNGIEVWSVNEGEQKIEQHVDKLMNYIRFWQAAGESEKTSIRTKTRLAQIVQEGCFRGGGVPFGYRLEKQGRVNKGNHEVNEILIDEEEAAVVRLIFDLYISKGYGSQRIATYLRKQGILNRKGDSFANCTIHHMLGNKSYIGVLKSGETVSEIFPHLQIIDPRTYEAAQSLLLQRSAAYRDRRVPLNTTGRSLLSGNVFCGHCGSRLTVTTNGKKYKRKDGEVSTTPRVRYVCYNKTRHPDKCDGQTGYTVGKLDGAIEKIVRDLFKHFSDVPKDALITARYAERVAEYRRQLDSARENHQTVADEAAAYEREVIKVIRGDSKLSPDLLNKLYEEAKAKAEESALVIKRIEAQISDSEQMRDSLSLQYDEMRTWADIYDGIDMEAKNMILSRIMKNIRVRRDYEIEIDLTLGCEQLGIQMTSIM